MREIINLITFKRPAITDIIEDMAGLRIDIFKEYPYLYDGNLEYEKDYLNTYSQSENAIIIAIFVNGLLAGAITGLPLSEEVDEFKNAFLNNGLTIDNVFYIGECILLPQYRNMKLSKLLFDELEWLIKRKHIYNTICFSTVERSENHPLKPDDYLNNDLIWQKKSYVKHENISCTFEWKDIDKNESDAKKMIFWSKEL
ncbi:MAG: GNAT family N-acetyltransferase [Pseudarcicella sp.]|nr:GNAT family N-acetyltransferase [Pseudarcicella sp.]